MEAYNLRPNGGSKEIILIDEKTTLLDLINKGWLSYSGVFTLDGSTGYDILNQSNLTSYPYTIDFTNQFGSSSGSRITYSLNVNININIATIDSKITEWEWYMKTRVQGWKDTTYGLSGDIGSYMAPSPIIYLGNTGADYMDTGIIEITGANKSQILGHCTKQSRSGFSSQGYRYLQTIYEMKLINIKK